MPDEEAVGYLNNWYVQNDLMCTSKLKIAGVVSWFFIGYFIGSSMFFLPDTYGRKKSMTFGLIFNILGCYLTTFYASPILKAIGFFLLGLFH